ncbi:Asp23/Gls24 family envelope stress response protein [Streptococcus saliviloxodontae]|uniref:Stress response regulator gls24 homolog n=1 Tax=Streptococcus saliviloxodontae TaxID=1349416 RepID=A0ABS2PJ98_9STRE|nr:Asp23/Gls24 family envelope stress response protein [Streptococcus saliviloxodontae]MBM7635429.1 putative alkaline shock family protein YloU [Streptococcus saliviloxodontae]
MTETKKNTEKQAHGTSALKGDITYENKVIEKIIGKSLETVDGLLAVNGGFFTNLKNKVVNSEDVTEGIHVEVGTKQVATDLKIVTEYGKDIPAIVDNIKAIISERVLEMTHLEVVEVNVAVVDIQTKEEFEASQVTLQDRVTEAGRATGEFVSEQSAKAGEAISNTTDKVKAQIEESRVK